MILGQDVVVLLKLHLRGAAGWTVRSLAYELGYDRAGVARSINRLVESGLHEAGRSRPPVPQSAEFLTHAVKYVFPGRLAGPARGIAAAWGVEPLSSAVVVSEPAPPVWPHPRGDLRGLGLAPVHPLAVDASEKDPELRSLLSLVDALRIGDARVRRVAGEMLVAQLRATAEGEPA